MRRLPDLDRRWWVAGAVVLVAIVAIVLSETVLNRTSEECKPVRALLEYNHEQTKVISDKGDDASIADYERWADGLAERSGKVTDPELATQSVRLAQLAGQFAVKLPAARAQTNLPPGTDEQAPPIAYEMAGINAQIGDALQQLLKACPD